MTKKKGGPKPGRRPTRRTQEEARREQRARECRHPKGLWSAKTNTKGQTYFECKCGAFMGFK